MIDGTLHNEARNLADSQHLRTFAQLAVESQQGATDFAQVKQTTGTEHSVPHITLVGQQTDATGGAANPEPAPSLDRNLKTADVLSHLLEPLHIMSVQEDGAASSTSADGYAARTFVQMEKQYGSERLNQVVEGLSNVSPNEVKILGNGLAAQNLTSDFQSDMDKKLGIIAKLAEPGAIENFTSMANQMRTEGFKGTFPYSTMTREFVDHMQSSPEERKAYIAFSQADRRTALAFIRSHRGAFDGWSDKSRSFVDQLSEFEAFAKTFTPGK